MVKLQKINFSFCGLDFLNGIYRVSIPFLLKLTGAQKIKISGKINKINIIKFRKTGQVKNMEEKCCNGKHKCGCGACGGGAYGLAFLGAAIYYIQHANSFWMGVLGILKAIVWPAILVYKLLEFLVK